MYFSAHTGISGNDGECVGIHGDRMDWPCIVSCLYSDSEGSSASEEEYTDHSDIDRGVSDRTVFHAASCGLIDQAAEV